MTFGSLSAFPRSVINSHVAPGPLSGRNGETLAVLSFQTSESRVNVGIKGFLFSFPFQWNALSTPYFKIVLPSRNLLDFSHLSPGEFIWFILWKDSSAPRWPKVKAKFKQIAKKKKKQLILRVETCSFLECEYCTIHITNPIIRNELLKIIITSYSERPEKEIIGFPLKLHGF